MASLSRSSTVAVIVFSVLMMGLPWAAWFLMGFQAHFAFPWWFVLWDIVLFTLVIRMIVLRQRMSDFEEEYTEEQRQYEEATLVNNYSPNAYPQYAYTQPNYAQPNPAFPASNPYYTNPTPGGYGMPAPGVYYTTPGNPAGTQPSVVPSYNAGATSGYTGTNPSNTTQ